MLGLRGYSFEQLRTAIVCDSVSDRWDEARLEWRLHSIYFREVEAGYSCICGHTPICEICIIKNKLNRNELEVGNCCVKRFMGIRSDKIFAAIKRISKHPAKALNDDAISFFARRGAMSEWEKNFYFGTWRKRKLSLEQHKARVRINRKVLGAVRMMKPRALEEKGRP